MTFTGRLMFTTERFFYPARFDLPENTIRPAPREPVITTTEAAGGIHRSMKPPAGLSATGMQSGSHQS
jgi:hypothetical protein